jgi:hypothetical protein
MKTIFCFFCFIFLLSSCKKNYICECVTTTASSLLPLPIPPQTSTQELKKMRKKQAIEKCDEGDGVTNITVVSITTECEIK